MSIQIQSADQVPEQQHEEQAADASLPLMQRALGEQWHDLPRGLKQHYSQREDGSSHESGWLTISYPRWMQWPLRIMRYLGALPDKAGDKVPTQVNKRMIDQAQHWARVVNYPDGDKVMFDSRVTYAGDDLLIEHVNRLLAIRMRVYVHEGTLYYCSDGYLLTLGKWELVIPDWLALGYGYIEETALSADRFEMNFWLEHPWFGEVYRYRGEFRID